MWASPCKIRSVSEKSVHCSTVASSDCPRIPSHRVTSDRSVFPLVRLKFVSLIVQSGWFSPPEVRLFGMGVDEAQGGTYLPPRGPRKIIVWVRDIFSLSSRGGETFTHIPFWLYALADYCHFIFILFDFISTVFCLVRTIKIDWSINLFMLFCFFTAFTYKRAP